MTIDFNQLLHELMANGMFLPVLGLLGWVLRNYLRDKFVSIDDFNAYKEGRGEEEREYREHVKDEFEDKQNYLQTIDRKVNENAKEIARIEGKLE